MNTVTLQTPVWRSFGDDSRPAGDSPTKGDYITTAKACFRVVDAVRREDGGWSLTCEEVHGPEPWRQNADPDRRVFSWAWRTEASGAGLRPVGTGGDLVDRLLACERCGHPESQHDPAVNGAGCLVEFQSGAYCGCRAFLYPERVRLEAAARIVALEARIEEMRSRRAEDAEDMAGFGHAAACAVQAGAGAPCSRLPGCLQDGR